MFFSFAQMSSLYKVQGPARSSIELEVRAVASWRRKEGMAAGEGKEAF